MQTVQTTIQSLKSLERFTQNFCQAITPKVDQLIVFLSGPLGSGKTSFTQILAKTLFKDRVNVNSPTFTYFNLYESVLKQTHKFLNLEQNTTKVSLMHADLYRLEDELSLESIGFWHALENSHIACIEWAEKFDVLYKDKNINAIKLKLDILPQYHRSLEISQNTEILDLNAIDQSDY